MSDSGHEAQPLELDIYGQSFRLRAPWDEHDRLQRAARHVDNVMRQIVVAQITPDTSRLAIQAALRISYDYLRLMDDIAHETGATDENKRRVDDLLQRLEESLKTL